MEAIKPTKEFTKELINERTLRLHGLNRKVLGKQLMPLLQDIYRVRRGEFIVDGEKIPGVIRDLIFEFTGLTPHPDMPWFGMRAGEKKLVEIIPRDNEKVVNAVKRFVDARYLCCCMKNTRFIVYGDDEGLFKKGLKQNQLCERQFVGNLAIHLVDNCSEYFYGK